MRGKIEGLAFVVLFFGVVAALGGLGGYTIVRDFAAGRAAEAWPATEGLVIRERAGSASRRSRRSAGGRSITYQYEVAGRGYEGTRIAYLHGLGLTTRKQRAEAYDVGDTVLVRYDPGDPSVSVLEPGAPVGRAVAGLLITGGFLVLGLYGGARGIPAALSG